MSTEQANSSAQVTGINMLVLPSLSLTPQILVNLATPLVSDSRLVEPLPRFPNSVMLLLLPEYTALTMCGAPSFLSLVLSGRVLDEGNEGKGLASY